VPPPLLTPETEHAATHPTHARATNPIENFGAAAPLCRSPENLTTPASEAPLNISHTPETPANAAYSDPKSDALSHLNSHLKLLKLPTYTPLLSSHHTPNPIKNTAAQTPQETLQWNRAIDTSQPSLYSKRFSQHLSSLFLAGCWHIREVRSSSAMPSLQALTQMRQPLP